MMNNTDTLIDLKTWLENHHPPRSKSIYHIQYTFDLITAATKQIEQLQREVNNLGDKLEYWISEANALAEENNKLQQRIDQQWISVEDRLPENDGMYLGWHEDWGVNEVHFYQGQFKPIGLIDDLPTHWQPLPPAPDAHD